MVFKKSINDNVVFKQTATTAPSKFAQGANVNDIGCLIIHGW